jgi:hypothetical protein
MGFGNIDTSGQCFHMRAWDNSNNYATAYRSFDNVLAVGQSLSAQFAVAFRSGYKGFNLWQDKNFTNFLVNFEVRQDADDYYFNGPDTGWAYSQTSIINLSAYRATSTTTNVLVVRGSDFSAADRASASFTSAGGVGGLEVYVNRCFDGNSLQGICFNNIAIY